MSHPDPRPPPTLPTRSNKQARPPRSGLSLSTESGCRCNPSACCNLECRRLRKPNLACGTALTAQLQFHNSRITAGVHRGPAFCPRREPLFSLSTATNQQPTANGRPLVWFGEIFGRTGGHRVVCFFFRRPDARSSGTSPWESNRTYFIRIPVVPHIVYLDSKCTAHFS